MMPNVHGTSSILSAMNENRMTRAKLLKFWDKSKIKPLSCFVYKDLFGQFSVGHKNQPIIIFFGIIRFLFLPFVLSNTQKCETKTTYTKNTSPERKKTTNINETENNCMCSNYKLFTGRRFMVSVYLTLSYSVHFYTLPSTDSFVLSEEA